MFSRRATLVVGILVLVAANVIALAVIGKKSDRSYGLGRIAIVAVAPFQKAIVGMTRSMRQVWEHYFFLVNVAEENDRLRRQARQLEQLSNRCRELELANERLARLLSLTKQVSGRMVAAHVVGKDPSPWFHAVIVDKGGRDGVKRGMPAITPEGVVGVVVETAGRYAKIQLVIDPNSGMDVLVQDTRARGVLKGMGRQGCQVRYLLRRHPVKVGQKIVTSGMDGVFPKGLAVGTVIRVDRPAAGIFQQAAVAPSVDFERLEEVLIMMGGNDRGKEKAEQ